MTLLERTLESIVPADRTLQSELQAHMDSLTKPVGSLGRLEQLAIRFCMATGTVKPVLKKKRIYCFAGDHGVAAEGVSAYPAEVTAQMVKNMLAGGAAINVLADHVGADLVVVDMGVNDPLRNVKKLVRKKIRRGTDNIAAGPAMTLAEAQKAVEVGIQLARQARRNGIHLVGTGDMGIANTTSATALLSVFFNLPVSEITGRGAGLDDRGLQLKIRVVQKAIDVNRKNLVSPMHILAALGGFEIAAICGLVLGAVSLHIPVVVDGFISTAGAVAALMLKPAVRDYLFFGHLSRERGHERVMERLKVRPILDLRMRLGEGTGAALAMPLIEASLRIYKEMATFRSARVSERSK